MTNTRNLKLVAHRPKSGDAKSLKPLLDERDRLMSEVARLSALGSRRAQAEDALFRADEAIRSLDAEESASWRDWSQNPEQEQPAPRREARRALAAQRADAAGELDIARVAEAATLPRQRVLAAALRTVHTAILSHKLDAAVARARTLHAEAVEIADQVARPLIEIDGLRAYLRSSVDRSVDAGEHELAGLFGQAFEAISGLTPPTVRGDAAALARETARWHDALA